MDIHRAVEEIIIIRIVRIITIVVIRITIILIVIIVTYPMVLVLTTVIVTAIILSSHCHPDLQECSVMNVICIDCMGMFLRMFVKLFIKISVKLRVASCFAQVWKKILCLNCYYV